jgi:hypothetical protein
MEYFNSRKIPVRTVNEFNQDVGDDDDDDEQEEVKYSQRVRN